MLLSNFRERELGSIPTFPMSELAGFYHTVAEINVRPFVVYSSTYIHIYILDTYRRNDNNAGRLLYKNIYLSLYCKCSKGLFKVCVLEGAGDRT